MRASGARPALLLLLFAADGARRRAHPRLLSDVQVQKDGSLEVTETIDVRAENDAINHGISAISRPAIAAARQPGPGRLHLRRRDARRQPCRPRPRPLATASGSRSATPTNRPSASIATSSATGRRARSAASRTMTSSTGTRPATAGSSRSTSPKRASACPSRPSSASAPPTPVRRARPRPNAEVVDEKPGEIRFRTTQPLGPYEGLTVAVAFPKGVVAEPIRRQRAGWWLADYGPAAGRLLALLGLLRGFYYFAWQRAGRDPRAGTVVPIFSPPDDLSPAACAT
jgi:hypothetical protein